ncbi:ribonuclease J [Thalassospiraceae bacterium LMO-JJ14]|nr:ribonuclease J [Thalassospiraceae bacterium LMO-JJ14]
MSDELLFLPLGGAGEIGMNLNLYGLGNPKDPTWLMIDFGITFGDGSPPGVDLITPDPTFIEQRRDRLAGLVLTHAHEDHLGAVPYLWDRIRCPIYATPFTMEILKRKLSETDFGDEVELHEIPLDGAFKVGPFDLDLITLTHSIPEPNGIAIKTPLGTVLHTGDWKFDPDPVIGEVSDEAALARLGDKGVLAIVCDSTNVFSPGHSGSEADLAKALTEIIGNSIGKVAVACFATNVARLHTVAKAAEACGRDVVLAGRSLQRTTTAARKCGYLDDVAPFLDEDAAGFIPDDRQLIICTGSQGESRAALARIATNSHPRISMGKGDTVIFSSRVIPGNEVGISAMKNNLARLGVKIVEDSDAHIHVSGHPNREELVEMYQHVRPEISIPVHGERRHLEKHAELARECQVTHTIVNENGGMIRLAPGNPEVVDHVTSGRLVYDGNRMIPMQGEAIRSRVQGLWNGTAVVSLCIDKDGRPVGEMMITTTGMLEPVEEDAVLDQVADDIYDAIERLSKRKRSDDEEVSETVRLTARRSFRRLLDKKPITDVHLIRV